MGWALRFAMATAVLAAQPPMAAAARSNKPDNVQMPAPDWARHSTAQMDRIEQIARQAKFTGSIGLGEPRYSMMLAFAEKPGGWAPDIHSTTPWRWASVTKQVIAVLVMQEVAKGRIALDSPVSRYIPRFASPNAAKVTVRQLLRHQSGLPNPDDTYPGSSGVATFYLAGFAGSRDPMSGYCAGPVISEPGQSWRYNNCDFMVAGAVLEAVTGKPWSRLVNDRIAKPLKLRTLTAEPRAAVRRTGRVDGKPEPAIDFSAYGAAAGLSGSVDDLITLDLALLDGKLLKPEALAQLWDGKPELGYIALGQWVFEASLKGCTGPVRIVERRGAIGGVQVRNFILPGNRLALAAFTDRADFAFGELWQGSGFAFDLLSAAACPPASETKP